MNKIKIILACSLICCGCSQRTDNDNSSPGVVVIAVSDQETASRSEAAVTVPETSTETPATEPEITESELFIQTSEGKGKETESDETASSVPYSPSYRYVPGAITEEGKTAVKKLIADYLASEQEGIDDNGVIWQDFDELYAAVGSEQANMWVDIVSQWDKAIAGGFVDGELSQKGGLCFVVLGYKLNPDGTMDNELVGRLQRALALAGEYPDAKLLCSGGNTTGTCAEAEVMAAWLVQHGISADRILAETRSRTTIENVLYSYDILYNAGIRNIVVVTSHYHLTGAVELFQEQCLLEGNEITVAGAVPCESSMNTAFTPATLAAWMYDLFYRQ